MSEQSDIRWHQRFDNFEETFIRLKEAVERNDLNELERNGLVQRFEFTLEMAWKTLKDYLEDKNFEFKASPKDTFRLAQEKNYYPNQQSLFYSAFKDRVGLASAALTVWKLTVINAIRRAIAPATMKYQ